MVIGDSMSIFKHKSVKVPGLDKLNMDTIEEKASDILMRLAGDALPTEDQLSEAADKLVEWLDSQVDYGGGLVGKVIDSYDQVLLRWLAHLLVHRLYTELKAVDAFSE